MSVARFRPSHVAFVAVVACLLGVALDRTAFAQQSGITRTVLGRIDVPQGPQYEGVMAIAEIAAGASSGKHRHPGVELAYVLEGSMTVEHSDGTSKTYKAGDSFQHSDVHNAKNTSKVPVKILAVYIVEKGKPMAEPVP